MRTCGPFRNQVLNRFQSIPYVKHQPCPGHLVPPGPHFLISPHCLHPHRCFSPPNQAEMASLAAPFYWISQMLGEAWPWHGLMLFIWIKGQTWRKIVDSYDFSMISNLGIAHVFFFGPDSKCQIPSWTAVDLHGSTWIETHNVCPPQHAIFFDKRQWFSNATFAENCSSFSCHESWTILQNCQNAVAPQPKIWKIQSEPIIIARDIPGFCLNDKCVTR